MPALVTTATSHDFAHQVLKGVYYGSCFAMQDTLLGARQLDPWTGRQVCCKVWQQHCGIFLSDTTKFNPHGDDLMVWIPSRYIDKFEPGEARMGAHCSSMRRHLANHLLSLPAYNLSLNEL